MKTIREQFEEIWLVPEGVFWSPVFGAYVCAHGSPVKIECMELNVRLDTFTRCQETTAIHLSLIDELVQSLQWYVDEDEINEGQEGNEYWLDGKHEAEALLDRAKQFMEQKK